MSTQVSSRDDEINALEELLELVVKLKKTGVLDLLNRVVDIFDRNREAAENLLTLIEGLLEGISQAYEGQEDKASLKQFMTRASKCVSETIQTTDLARAKPLGLTGILSSLRDKNVQKGIGVIFELLRQLGRCYSED